MKKIKLDQQQKLIKASLDDLASKLHKQKKPSFLNFFKKNPYQENLKSIYIFGDVGRGKSMLMQEFYQKAKVEKFYSHFNEFMEMIHLNLKDIRQENKYYKDELIEATKRIVKNNKLICFDEFGVSDVADAMLLSRIFNYIFSQKIIVVFTSNFAPKKLYPNGLQRQRFLEFVDLILLKNCQILNLDSTTDYRKKYSTSHDIRFFKIEQKELFYNIIDNLKQQQNFQKKTLKVWGRKINIQKTFNANKTIIKKYFLNISQQQTNKISKKSQIKIAVFDFHEIVNNDFSASDFRVISKEFDLIFLLNLEQLKMEDINEAKRFVLFIDEIYEKKVALLILSNINITNIFDKYYHNCLNSRIYLRAKSRINEIKSDTYFFASKILE